MAYAYTTLVDPLATHGTYATGTLVHVIEPAVRLAD
jgi:hypothetical protein